MNYNLCRKYEEIVILMSKVHNVDTEFLLDQLMHLSISLLLTDAKRRTPDEDSSFFEEYDLPCDIKQAIDDNYIWFKEMRETILERFGFALPNQPNTFDLDRSSWVQAKDVAIDCLQDVTA